jgi:hypothetical protein
LCVYCHQICYFTHCQEKRYCFYSLLKWRARSPVHKHFSACYYSYI